MFGEGDWRRHLPRAKHVRRNPATAQCPDVTRWLESLDGPFAGAAAELENEIVQRFPNFR